MGEHRSSNSYLYQRLREARGLLTAQKTLHRELLESERAEVGQIAHQQDQPLTRPLRGLAGLTGLLELNLQSLQSRFRHEVRMR